MNTLFEMILSVVAFALVVFLIEFFSKAMDYRIKIQKIALNSYDYFRSKLRSNENWSCHLTNDWSEKGDFVLNLGVDLSTSKRQFLILNYLKKAPDGRGFRKGAKQLYRELIGM